MSTLKILISHTSIYKKAGWGRIFPLSVGLAKQGNTVTIITTNPHFSIFIKKVTIDDVKILIFPEIIPSRISRMGFGFLSLILKVLYVILRKFDVVHSDNGHRPLSGIPCRINKRIYGSIYIAEWYDWYGLGGQYDTKKKIFKFFLGHYELKQEVNDKIFADGVVVLSEVLRERMRSYDQEKKILLLHGGADVVSIPYLKYNKTIKEKYGINKETITFGYIDAYSVCFKEIQPLIDVIIEENLQDKIKLLVFGRTNSLSGSIPTNIKEMVIDFGWINYNNDYEKLQCVDVFVKFNEDILGVRAGWPNCIGDYLACGRPIFLYPLGEVKKFVEKYPKGFFVSTLSYNSIREKLLEIIQYPNDLVEMGQTNRLIAENEISWQKKSDLLLEFYQSILISKQKYFKNQICN